MKRNGIKKRVNPQAEYLSPRDASEVTGLSIGYIRNGCRNGNIPHVIRGQGFLVHMPAFREMLAEAAREGRNI